MGQWWDLWTPKACMILTAMLAKPEGWGLAACTYPRLSALELYMSRAPGLLAGGKPRLFAGEVGGPYDWAKLFITESTPPEVTTRCHHQSQSVQV